jgi:transposase
MGLPLRRGLSRTRRRRRPGAALCRHRGHECPLAEIAATVASSAHALLVLDGAGWHRAEELRLPHNISLLRLPPAAPELNPVENVWQYVRSNWLAISIFDDYDAIVEACCLAWNRFAQDPDTVTSITSRSWAKVTA